MYERFYFNVGERVPLNGLHFQVSKYAYHLNYCPGALGSQSIILTGVENVCPNFHSSYTSK